MVADACPDCAAGGLVAAAPAPPPVRSTSVGEPTWWPRAPVPFDDRLLGPSERWRRTLQRLSLDPVPFLRDATDEAIRGADRLWMVGALVFALGQGLPLALLGLMLGSQIPVPIVLLEGVLSAGVLAALFTGAYLLVGRLLTRRRRDRLLFFAHAPLVWGLVPGAGGALGVLWSLRNTYLVFRLRGRCTPVQAALGVALPWMLCSLAVAAWQVWT